MESVISMEKRPRNFWVEEQVDAKNVFEFIDFLIDNYPQYKDELIDIKKKVYKKSKSVLSILITFVRRIDKNDRKNDELVLLMRKFIQVVMDNPKGFKR